MSTLTFFFWTALLIVEGSLITRFVSGNRFFSYVTVSLALPVAALVNAIIVFAYTIAGSPIALWSMLMAHIMMIAVFLYLSRKMRQKHSGAPVSVDHPKFWHMPTFARVLCVALLAVQAFFSLTHAVILPTYQIDSLTNWTMRSKVSFYDQKIAFDPTEVRGVAKPQYPILFHSLQLVVNQGNSDWSDRSANAILFLLTLSSFAALFFIIKYKKGIDFALLTLTFLFSIPLLSFHLAEGYADIVLIQYLLLIIGCLWRWKTDGNDRWLLMSGVLVACATWTKSEGLIVGLGLWILFFMHERFRLKLRFSFGIVLFTLFISLPYSAFLLSRGLGLTPHASDATFGWHGEAFASAISGLFVSGSMGMTWWVIIAMTLMILVLRHRKSPLIDASVLALGWFGLLSLVAILFTYIFTPNAVFLANGESYFRQLMIPAAKLILWCMLVFVPRPSRS